MNYRQRTIDRLEMNVVKHTETLTDDSLTPEKRKGIEFLLAKNEYALDTVRWMG